MKRAGNDLFMDTDIDLYTAVLGGETTIDTLSGKVKLKVSTWYTKRNAGKVKRKRISGVQKRRPVWRLVCSV